MINFTEAQFVIGLRHEVVSFTTRCGHVSETLKVSSKEEENDKHNVHAIIRKIADNGAFVIAEKPHSLVNSDYFLTTVLCWNGHQYVTWTYNAQTASCNIGRYFGGNLSAALLDFMERGTAEWEAMGMQAAEVQNEQSAV